MRFKPDLESLVLAAVAGGPKHGYDVAKAIRSAGEGALKVGDGQLYPILHRLEAREWIEAKWVEQEGRPDRKVYAITSNGTKELKKRHGEWNAFSTSVVALFDLREVCRG